jgi:RNA-splicing ligase RtcB
VREPVIIGGSRETGSALLERRGIVVRAAPKSGVAEQAGFAYKDLAAVVDVLHRLDLSARSSR